MNIIVTIPTKKPLTHLTFACDVIHASDKEPALMATLKDAPDPTDEEIATERLKEFEAASEALSKCGTIQDVMKLVRAGTIEICGV